MKARKYFLISAVMMLLVAMTSQNALCQVNATTKWVDQSGDLPGMSSSTGLLIAAGVLVTGGVVYLIVKNKKKKTQKASGFMENESEDILARSFYDDIKRAGEQAPIQLVVGQHNSNNYNMDSGGLSVGLRYKF